MSPFKLITRGLIVEPLVRQLDDHPELWDQHTERKQFHGHAYGPHQQMSDIWVRYRAFEELTAPHKYLEPHFPVFYPAWQVLPAMHGIVFNLARIVEATMIGGILITRIPPGGKIASHNDRGSWHAEFMDTKLYVPLRNNERCINESMGERIVMQVGEVWSFDNLVNHSVENNGDSERITLIISLRTK